MTILQAIIMGVIQGLTEFLPVSSSGHLVISADLYKYFTGSKLVTGGPEEIFLDILLHIATLVAVLIYFWPEFSAMFQPSVIAESLGLIKKESSGDFKTNLVNKFNNLSMNGKMLWFLGLSTTATIIIAYPLKDFAADLTANPFIVCFMLLITGFLLYGSHELSKENQESKEPITLKRALIMGFAQGAAILPGISRSGSTISAGLISGLSRVNAARFSFILSTPIIFLAALHEGIKFFLEGHMSGFNWSALLAGSCAAGVVGYLCIKYFIQFLSKYNLLAFAYYCWIVGLLMIVFYSYVR